ncbi:MAG: site-specific integrase [Oscillospiraceae bacterium]|jgi:integrase|nr:site-specific integrase [Oscillospiraceae bacterium]
MKPNYKGYLYRKTFTYQGKKYQITATDEKTLMRKVVEKQLQLERGEIVVNKNTTVARWVQQWLEIDKKPAVSASTYSKLVSIVNNHIVPYIGNYRLCDVQRQMLQKLLNDHAGGSFSLLSKIKIYIKEIFNAAERDELIIKNPSRFLVMPEFTKGEARVLTDEEYRAAAQLCKTHKDGLFFEFMLKYGLRRGEVAALMWSDIDFDNQFLNICRAVEFVGGNPQIKDTTKTPAGNRVIKLNIELIELLRKKLKQSDNIYIFTAATTGKLLTEKQIARKWSNFKRELDIVLGAELYRNEIVETKLLPGLHMHCLRHTAITNLVLAGADLKDVQTFAGHSDVQTTLNIYTHVNKKQAAKRVYDISGLHEKSG